MMKKVTLQDIANSLSISRTTVWKVFSGQEGVSDNLRAQILEKAQELNYKSPDKKKITETEITAPPMSPMNIAVTVCRPETSIFWMTIIHWVAKELSRHNVNLLYTYLPSSIDEDYVLPTPLTNGSTDGMIVMNVYNEHLTRLLAETHIPKVFLDTAASIAPAQLNGDLLLMESQTCISNITEHLIGQGRKIFGFIGDIHYARSNYERFEGFSRTLERHGLPFHPELALTGSIGIDTYKEEIDAFLDTVPRMPDAFVCANDHVGCILIPLLQKRGLHVPDDVAVSGFDGNTENPLAEELTTVQVFNPDIGLRLALQILYRIRHPETQFEVAYIGSQVIFRNSTGDAAGL